MKKLLAIFVFLFASSAFAAPNLTGKWTIHNSIAGNENDQECKFVVTDNKICLLYTSPSPRDLSTSRMPSSA